MWAYNQNHAKLTLNGKDGAKFKSGPLVKEESLKSEGHIAPTFGYINSLTNITVKIVYVSRS